MGPEVNFPKYELNNCATANPNMRWKSFWDLHFSESQKIATVASKGIFDWNRRIVHLKDRLVWFDCRAKWKRDSTFEVLPPLEEVDNASKKIDSRNEKQHDKCLYDVEKDFFVEHAGSLRNLSTLPQWPFNPVIDCLYKLGITLAYWHDFW
jgi:hypothetical protein